MGSTLFGQQINTTYEGLIKTSDNAAISGTSKYLSDGLGNNLPIAVNTSNVGIGTATGADKLEVGGNTVVTYNSGFYGYNSVSNKALLARVSNTVGVINYAEYATFNGLNGYLIGASNTSYIKGNFSANSIELSTAGSVRLAIISNGNVGLGLTNPATKLDVNGAVRASTGILFGTDTAAANTLDDYEEGIFVPTIIGTTSAGTATYSANSGTYTKIGNVVHVQIVLTWSSGTGTGEMRIGGLPFSIMSADAPTYPVFSISDADFSFTALHILAAEGQPSTTQIALVEIPVGGGARLSTTYTAAGTIILSGTYLAS
jgi:hypothetical protein